MSLLFSCLVSVRIMLIIILILMQKFCSANNVVYSIYWKNSKWIINEVTSYPTSLMDNYDMLDGSCVVICTGKAMGWYHVLHTATVWFQIISLAVPVQNVTLYIAEADMSLVNQHWTTHIVVYYILVENYWYL